MSLWNPKKPLNQPPGYGRVGYQNTSAPKSSEAARAIQSAQFERQHATQRVGRARAVVRS